MIFHNDARSTEAHSFHLETEALFERHIEFEADASPGSQNTLPRECFAFLSEQLDNLTVVERIPGRGRDLRVRCHLAFRNGPDSAAKRGVAIRAFRRAKEAASDLVRHAYLPRRRKVTPSATVNGSPGVACMRPIAGFIG